MTTGPEEEPLLPEVTSDERDVGWGEEPTRRPEDPDDLDRFLREVPPHHGD